VKIAHFGTFDVHNYGDLLFPLVAEKKLEPISSDVVHVSPIGSPMIYRDVPPSVDFATASEIKFDGVVIGGGNILHSGWSNLAPYKKVQYGAYPGLWLNAAILARKQDIPLVVNAPGAPHAFPWPASRLIAQLTEQAAYFAVRDEYSQARIIKAGGRRVGIVPDSALQLSDVIAHRDDSVHELGGEFSDLRRGGYIAVHVNGRYVDREIQDLAKVLDRLSADFDMRLCLIGIGPCHGDDVYARTLGSKMSSRPIVFDSPQEVSAVAHLIADSKFYLGSSLHGFITASSYGVPALLVANHQKQSKFRGLLAQVGGDDRMFESWEAAIDALAGTRRTHVLLDSAVDLTSARAALDEHWRLLRAGLTGPSGPSKSNFNESAGLKAVEMRNFAEISARRVKKNFVDPVLSRR
jgi:polysaccharide pyruvyl transferase WcaK-like protein